jgi:hypothetical protein
MRPSLKQIPLTTLIGDMVASSHKAGDTTIIVMASGRRLALVDTRFYHDVTAWEPIT